MAETTPGPLIQVVQYVGFMGAYRHPEPLSPITAGIVGSVVTTWVTFAPCFLWIFLGAPYIEHLRGNKVLGAALSTITAAVVGVILNLAIWLAAHVLFAEVHPWQGWGMRVLVPQWRSIDLASLLIAAAALVALLRWKRGLLTTLAASTACGMLWFLIAGDAN